MGMKRVMACALALLTGCGLGFGPGPDLPKGAYVLQSVDGNALPFTMRDDEEVGRWVLHADTLFILGGGRAEWRRVIEVTGSTFQADTIMDSRNETTYRVVDDRVDVGFFDCPINAVCNRFKTGEIIPGGFTLPMGLIMTSGTGVYLRTP